MSGETIDFKVTVDAKQAQGVVANLRSEILSMRSAIAEGKGIDHLGEQAKQLQSKLGPAAAAISGVSAALGEQAGEAGKAVAAVGQMVAAFGAGGPYGVAIAAATLATNKFVSALEAANKEQDAAIAKTYEGVDAVSARNRAIEAEIAKMRREQGIDVDTPQSIQARADAEIAAINSKLDAVRKESRTNLSASDEKRAAYRGEIVLLERQRELVERRANLEIGGLARAKPALETAIKDYKDLAKALEDAARASSVAMGASLSGGGFSGISAAMQEQTGPKGLGEALAIAEVQAESRREKAKLEAAREALAARVDAERKANAILEQEREAAANKAVSTYAGLATSLATATGELAVDALSGSDEALGAFISKASQAAGGFVALEGGKLLATGIASATNPITAALAPGQIAAGLGLVAAGAAISAGGPAAVAALSGGSRGASASPSAGSRDPGASPRSGGTTGSGGPLVVNVSYGVAGPLPEDTARAISQAVRTGGRR